MAADSSLNSQRVFKKSSPNNKLTLYLASRDLVVETNSIDRIQGVLHVDPEHVDNKKLYGQVTLTFRYGREDEEVMGLKFCNEAIMSLAQVWPLNCNHEREPSTALQEALMKRLGAHAYPFQLELTPLAPPSVQLVPAKQYHGAPIGTSYDVRAFIAEKVDEKVSRRNMVRMGIRVLQGASRAAAAAALPPPSPAHSSLSAMAHHQLLRIRGRKKQQEETSKEQPDAFECGVVTRMRADNAGTEAAAGADAVDAGDAGRSHELDSVVCRFLVSEAKIHFRSLRHGTAEAGESSNPTEPAAPRVVVEKPFLLCDGRLRLEAWLDKSAYHHGEPIIVSFSIINHSNKTVRRIKAMVVQHVDVCMFSNGKFKNVVAFEKDNTPVLPGQSLDGSYTMIPSREVCMFSDSKFKNDVAMVEDDTTLVPPGQRLDETYTMIPSRGVTKNWIALEDSYSKTGACLASTVLCNSNSPDDRNVFAIYVSYYVKIKLNISGIGGELSVKLPFSLSHANINEAPTDSVMEEATHRMILEGRENSDDEDEEDKEDEEATADENQQSDLEEDSKTVNGRRCVSADVCVNIIENKLCERPRFEGPTQVRKCKHDDDDMNLIVRYPGPDT
ncbi:arrestin, lateral eye-like [Cydia splendana]|uniref:arrestin, lateral eye-like n=1 Tax=Cydia splendana TaxID=1100963 RepID=UPI00300D8F77